MVNYIDEKEKVTVEIQATDIIFCMTNMNIIPNRAKILIKNSFIRYKHNKENE